MLISIIPVLFLVTIVMLSLFEKIENLLFNSLLTGISLSTINFLLGSLSIKFGLEKSDKLFLIIVFGGLVVRLFLMLTLIVTALNFLYVKTDSFIFTTFIFYFYYLIVEIYILTQKSNFLIKQTDG